MSREKCDWKLQVGVPERIAKQVAAIADETQQSESAVSRYLLLAGLSSIGRMPAPNASEAA